MCLGHRGFALAVSGKKEECGRRPTIERERVFQMAIEAYCVKCKEKKVMKDPVESTTKTGKPITKGKCPDCGTTICRIGAAK